MFSFYLKIAFRNMKSYWRQSLAAIISVIAAFTAFVLFHGYLLHIFSNYRSFNVHLEMFGDLIVEKVNAFSIEGRANSWEYSLNEEQQNKINQTLKELSSYVHAYSRFLLVSGTLDTESASTSFQGISFDVNEAAQIRGPWKWDTFWGEPLQDSKRPNHQMIIGYRLAKKISCLNDYDEEADSAIKKYFIEIRKRPTARKFLCESKDFQLTAMTESGQMNALDLSVSGILDRGFVDRDSRYVALSLPIAQKLLNTKKVNYYAIKLNDHITRDNFVRLFNEKINLISSMEKKGNKKEDSIEIIPWEKHNFGELYKQTDSLLSVLRSFIITTIIIIGSLSVFNTLVKLVKERTKEIGMLRSLGFISRQIRRLYIFEALMLTLFGCLVGSVFSFVISSVINQLEITYPSGQFSMEIDLFFELSIQSYLYGFSLFMGISIFACFLAIHKTSKENISTLLIHS